jgi:hypothetical protein
MSQADLVYRIVAIIFPVFGIIAIGYLYARDRPACRTSSRRPVALDELATGQLCRVTGTRPRAPRTVLVMVEQAFTTVA